MGMLLSRFRAVIFPRSGRMKSGGLASEPAIVPTADEGETGHNSAGHDDSANQATSTEDERLYYGLHWRKELNWRALGFEFVEETDGVDGHEGVVFHA
jgi:tRNA-specific adenosine deaminase 3